MRHQKHPKYDNINYLQKHTINSEHKIHTCTCYVNKEKERDKKGKKEKEITKNIFIKYLLYVKNEQGNKYYEV